MDTNSTLEMHFKKMAIFLAEWRTKLHKMHMLAENFKYLRVGGNGFRPVSVHRDNPCGKLIKSDGKGTEVKTEAILSTALKSAMEAAPADAYTPGSFKREHTSQSGLIHHALTHDLRLDERLEGFSDFFDELIFVTDELNMESEKLRVDMIALGGKQGAYFPVLIELKAKRNFKEVIVQLVNAIETVSTASSSFVTMLAAATGKPAHSIAFDKYLLLAALPLSPSGREKANPETEVSNPGNGLAKGHLLIGHFDWVDDSKASLEVSPHDRFVSKITFRSQA